MALTKSRAAVAQWKLSVNRALELSPSSCTWLYCVKCFSLFADNAQRCRLLVSCPCVPSCSLWRVHPCPLNGTIFMERESTYVPSTKRTCFSTLCHCDNQAHTTSWSSAWMSWIWGKLHVSQCMFSSLRGPLSYQRCGLWRNETLSRAGEFLWAGGG